MTAMECLPDSLRGRRFYHPTDQGPEARYRERLEQILTWKEARRKEPRSNETEERKEKP